MAKVTSQQNLSEREMRIADMYANGMTYKEIAEQISRSPSTVRNHVNSIYQKLGVSSKIELLQCMVDELGESAQRSDTALIFRSSEQLPSIAVLPFACHSGVAEHQFLSEGFSEDIITELSRFTGLVVIARNSSYLFHEKPTDYQAVSQQLGVRYLLDGSVRWLGEDIRINVQLIDTRNKDHIWAETYHQSKSDIFKLQNEIIRYVVGNIAPKIEVNELERVRSLSGEEYSSYELALKAQAVCHDALRSGSEDQLLQARAIVTQAVSIKSHCAHALEVASLVDLYIYMYGWMKSGENPLDHCEDTVHQLIGLDPSNAKAYMIRAWINLYRGNFDLSLADHQRSLNLNPNLAMNIFAYAWSAATSGQLTLARKLAEQGFRLSPQSSDIWTGEGRAAIALCYFLNHEFDIAIENGLVAYQRQPILQGILAAAYALTNDATNARKHFDLLSSFAPRFVTALLDEKISIFKQSAHNELFRKGVRLAEAD